MIINETILKLYSDSNKYGKLLGMNLKIVSEGEVKYTLKIKEKHLATPVAAHGGVVAGLIDGALGVAALTVSQKNGNIVGTVSLNINFLKPVEYGDNIIATGKVVSAGKRLIYVEAAVINQKDVLVAKANGVFNAYPFKKVY